jgi:hypothetical protein
LAGAGRLGGGRGQRGRCPSRRGGFGELAGNPSHEEEDDVALVGLVKRDAFGDAVPFGEASAAAAGGGVLGGEDGVAAHGGLLSVVGGTGGGEAGADEVSGMAADGVEALAADVGEVAGGEAEASAEGGAGQPVEDVVEGWWGIGHSWMVRRREGRAKRKMRGGKRCGNGRKRWCFP